MPRIEIEHPETSTPGAEQWTVRDLIEDLRITFYTRDASRFEMLLEQLSDALHPLG